MDGAIADYNQAIQINPTNSSDYDGRAWAKFQKNDFDAAIADAVEAIRLNPTNGYAYGTRGWARFGKGDTSGAVEDCRKAIELYGTNSVAIAYDQGMLDFINGDFQKAVTSWEKVIQSDVTLKRELQPWIEKAKAKLPGEKP